MTLDQLRYFSEAARFEHVGKAANSLHISPGSVSMAIMALEEEFGCALFRREGKRIYLNHEGQELLSQADEIFQRLSSLRANLQKQKHQLQGRFRVGGSHFLATQFLAPAWVKLQKKHPSLTGDLCSLPTALVMNELLRGTLDFGLCFSPLEHPDLEITTLYEGQLVLAVRKGHPVLKSKKLSDLSFYPATLHKSAPGVDICETHPNFAKYKIKADIRFQFDNDELALASLQGSDHWSLLPDLVVRTSSGLREVSLPESWRAPYSVALVARKGRRDDVLLNHLQNAVSDQLERANMTQLK